MNEIGRNRMGKVVFSLMLAFLIVSLSVETMAKDDARVAFEEANKLHRKGDMKAAVKKFRLANSLRPSWKIQFNIGQCEASLSRYGLAITAFEQYLGLGGDEVPVSRRDLVLAELDRLRKMVGTIEVEAYPGLDVYIDGVLRGNTSDDSSFKATVGIDHSIWFVKDGRKIETGHTIVSGGESSVVTMKGRGPSSFPGTASPNGQTTGKKQSSYTNMRQLKEALKKGVISEVEFEGQRAVIRRNRDRELGLLRQDYRSGKLDKREFKRRRAEIRQKYEGLRR
jgi:tetratricopeptide (TPR) repeat protein